MDLWDNHDNLFMVEVVLLVNFQKERKMQREVVKSVVLVCVTQRVDLTFALVSV